MEECGRIRDLVGSYVYDELDAAERASVEAHLRQCQRCRDEFAGTRRSIRGIPSDLLEPPPGAEERVLSGLTAAAMSRGYPARKMWGALGLALAGAALLALGVWIGSRLGRPPLSGDSRQIPIATAADIAAPKPALPATAAEPPTTAGHPSAEPTGPAEGPATGATHEGGGDAMTALQASDPVLIRAPRPLGLDDVTIATVMPD